MEIGGRHRLAPPAGVDQPCAVAPPADSHRGFFIGKFPTTFMCRRLPPATSPPIPPRCQPAGGRQNWCTQSPPTLLPSMQEDWEPFPPIQAASFVQPLRCRSGGPPTC